MSNTIELLETIGNNANLRHAPAEDLARTLTGLDASESLVQAAASGDSIHLTQELGYRALQNPNHVNQTAPEEEEGEPGQDDRDNDDLGTGETGED